MNEAIDTPPAMVASAPANNSFGNFYHSQKMVSDSESFVPSSGFLNYIKTVENGTKKGWNNTAKRWFTFIGAGDHANGIAYGHKLKPNEHFPKGLTEEEATNILYTDILDASHKAMHEVDSTFGKHTFNKLPLKSKEMLVDFVYNLGSLKSFPRFVNAVIHNDFNGMSHEFKRFSQGKELARNYYFAQRYLTSNH